MSVSIKPLIDAGFDLKGLKKWNSRDGGGYQFSLVFNTKTVAEVTNDGNGGEVRIDFLSLRWDGSVWVRPDATPAQRKKEEAQGALSAVAKAKLDEIVKATPPVDSQWGGSPLTVDAGWLMEEMVNHAELEKVCKTKTAFRLPTDGQAQYNILKAPFDASMRAYVLGKWPNAIILNENLFA